jgi:large subunit ribosomal protein L5
VASLLQKYRDDIAPAMTERFGYKNVMAVPKLQKIVLSAGVGQGDNKDRLPQALEDLTLISGQKAVPTKARKSVANFKLRAGMSVGARVTLRGTMMYDFLERLIGVAIPRFRDFRGLPEKSFDGHGDYTFGIYEQAVFPEIDQDKIKAVQGMHVTLVTSAKTNDEGRELLRLFGMPFATS